MNKKNNENNKIKHFDKETFIYRILILFAIFLLLLTSTPKSISLLFVAFVVSKLLISTAGNLKHEENMEDISSTFDVLN